MPGRRKVFTRNILVIKAVLFFLLFGFPIRNGFAADQSDSQNVIEKVFHTSKPVFDPESYKDQPVQADPFLSKLNQKKRKFLTKQQEKRKKFLSQLNQKILPPLEKQERLREFEQKQADETQKFLLKQKEKMERHFGGT